MASDSLYGIRATRATPLGYALDDQERKAVYGSALAQFDELIAAAASVGPASRPLPLFYALSQAGRAIAAAHAEGVWRLRMHGLSAPDLDRAPQAIEVHRAPRENESWVDSVTGVAVATRTRVFTDTATIGALWASLPELFNLQPTSPDADPRPLRLVPENPGPENLHLQTDPGHVYATVVGFSGTADELVRHLAERYPTSGDPKLCQPQACRMSDSTPSAGTDSCFAGTQMHQTSTVISVLSTGSPQQTASMCRQTAPGWCFPRLTVSSHAGCDQASAAPHCYLCCRGGHRSSACRCWPGTSPRYGQQHLTTTPRT